MLDKQDKKMMWIIFAVITLLMGIPGALLSVNPITDESGTIANSMYLLGYDWSDYLVEYGSFYYKYGMALIFTPVYWIFSNPHTAYRVIIVLQAFMMGGTGMAVYVIFRKHLCGQELAPVVSRKMMCLISIVATAIPASILYSMYAKADSVLIMAPWIVLLLLLEGFKEESTIRRIICATLLSLVSVYAYACHTRGAVVLIATVMVVVIGSIILKKQVTNLIAYFTSTVVFFMIDKWLTAFFKEPLWGTNAGHASADAIDFAEMLEIFTPEGLVAAVKSVIGWFYNASVATCGLLVLGGVAAVVFIIRYFKKKESSPQELLFSIFAMLMLLGTFAMGILFFSSYLQDRFYQRVSTRGDMIVYGRYIVGAFGPLVLLAIYSMFKRRDLIGKKCRFVATAIFAATIFMFAWKVVEFMQGIECRSRYFISLCTFLHIDGGSTTTKFSNIAPALLAAGFLAFTLFLIMMYLDSKDKLKAVCVIALVAFLAIYAINFVKVRYSRDELLVSRTETAENYIRGFEEIAEEYPYIAAESTSTNIRVYQVLFRQFKLANADSTAIEDVDNMIVIAKYNQKDLTLNEGDVYTFDDYPYTKEARDVVYIKGEELKAELEAKGYKLSLYTDGIDDGAIDEEVQMELND